MHKKLKPKIRESKTFAAVMTGKGTGAIATIQIFGNSVKEILEKIFEPAADGKARLEKGKILLGNIKRADQIIDEVTIGCEEEDCFAINCHGNPLIAADIMNLLKKLGARLIKPDDILKKIYKSQGLSTIEIESKLAMTNAKTLTGSKIISNQVKDGLKKKASGWLKNKKNLTIEKIRKDTEQILENTKRAKPIIFGAKIVLAGPANSGKSTLLNFLAGKQKAIVTDIAGTTLDYVRTECKIGTLHAQIIDTAGIRTLNSENKPIEKEAQRGSVKIISDADMVLLIIDNSKKEFQLDKQVMKKILSKLVIAVLNKSDLAEQFNSKNLLKDFDGVVKISAKTGYGIDKLIEKINEKFEVNQLDIHAAVCVSKRQKRLIRQLKYTNSKKMAFDIISELLNGRV